MKLKIEGTSSTLSIKAVINVARVEVDDPLEWLSLSVSREKRIYGSFEDYVVSLYECLFTRI